MQKITTYLWYDGRAEEAMTFYTSVFPNSRIVSMSRYPDGRVMAGTFEIEGQQFMVLNGGPQYRFTPAVSLFVNCETQEEVDELWEKLTSDGGEESRCGWLVDKFGLSWQIIPSALGRYLGDPDPEKAGRAAQAMLRMNKIDLEQLRLAYEG